MSEYTDVREIIDGYKKLQCRYCDSVDWYNPQFCCTHDEGLCPDCQPDVSVIDENHVTVRI